jgi:fructosamine-3-kinase
VGGGSINECYAWRCGAGLLFVKVAARAGRVMFEAEAAGLAELAGARALRVPRVIGSGQTESAAFLALEWIEAVPAEARCERRLGEALAALHAVTAERFGSATTTSSGVRRSRTAGTRTGRSSGASGACAHS